MKNVRRDYILRRWSYIAEARGSRPFQFSGEKKGKADVLNDPRSCVFCPGSEALTPPEIGRIEDGRGGWLARWIPNKFPAVVLAEGERHEVIIETPEHDKQLWDFSHRELARLIWIWRERIKYYLTETTNRYAVLFKNHGKEAGASIEHSHTQLIATKLIPPLVIRESRASWRDGRCLYCEIIKKERTTERLCYENDDFVTFTPFAPRVSFEAWIFPKFHVEDLKDFSAHHDWELAENLLRVLRSLRRLGVPYCFYFHYGTKNNRLHLHLEVLPRTGIWGGFELASEGSYIVTASPEKAADYYRRDI